MSTNLCLEAEFAPHLERSSFCDEERGVKKREWKMEMAPKKIK